MIDSIPHRVWVLLGIVVVHVFVTMVRQTTRQAKDNEGQLGTRDKNG